MFNKVKFLVEEGQVLKKKNICNIKLTLHWKAKVELVRLVNDIISQIVHNMKV